MYDVCMCSMYVVYIKMYLYVLYAYVPLFLHACVCIRIFQGIAVSVYPSKYLSILCTSSSWLSVTVPIIVPIEYLIRDNLL